MTEVVPSTLDARRNHLEQLLANNEEFLVLLCSQRSTSRRIAIYAMKLRRQIADFRTSVGLMPTNYPVPGKLPKYLVD